MWKSGDFLLREMWGTCCIGKIGYNEKSGYNHDICDVEHMWYHVICIVDHGLYDRHIHVGVPSGMINVYVKEQLPHVFPTQKGPKNSNFQNISVETPGTKMQRYCNESARGKWTMKEKEKYHFDQQILTMHVINELGVLVENEGQNLDDQKMLWQLGEKMDQKFYEKLAQRAIPPPMKIVRFGESARGKWTMKEN
ncbi:hypothetical protein PFMG_00277 [Plasmodium falciparum IGH-CR14]|uniref:Uncharacterized protein n=1 Tax=Plasmodium falciparum IGH-CR14 TaxID=580059 RepID=A0A0L1I374_PLAFA|nr:hypothetical protein PFMG_00277 [Plasmodium falciparum IGH-CR14]